MYTHQHTRLMKFIDRIFVCKGKIAVDICPNLWENFSPTNNPKVRHCGVCSQNVHFCDTEKEIMRHANQGHCVAFADVDESALPKLRTKARFLGKPSKETYEKEYELDKADAKANGMTLVEYDDYQSGMKWELLQEKEPVVWEEHQIEMRNAFSTESEFQAFLQRREERKLIIEKQDRKALMHSVLSEAHIARRRCANCHAPVPQWFRNICKICGCTNTIERDSIIYLIK